MQNKSICYKNDFFDKKLQKNGYKSSQSGQIGYKMAEDMYFCCKKGSITK